ncbi:Enteropeptidase [Eumeta japonica]|uniref:Enteropeptidase n=1 Tax=Eumeta variegata TaxID=151549 RepID=A0A4C1TKE9_EUMVA|nr:Enteropeptidase [Eumeta japonica]
MLALVLLTLALASPLAPAAPALECQPCTCGVARGGRVVGGVPLAPGEFPWLAAVVRDGVVICGATVVARDHLITATHCVHGICHDFFQIGSVAHSGIGSECGTEIENRTEIHCTTKLAELRELAIMTNHPQSQKRS